MDLVTAQFRPTTVPEWPSLDSPSPDGWNSGLVRKAPADDSEAPAYSSRPTTERIPYIDTARGLFLILMASTHAIMLAGVPPTSVLAHWGLPRGWATTGLIML